MESEIKCCLIHPDAGVRQVLSEYVDRVAALRLVGSFGSPGEAVGVILGGGADMVVAAVEMPQMSGLELARILPRGCEVVLVGATDRYALQGFKVDAAYYLVEPVEYDDFLEAVGRVVERRGRVVSTGDGDERRYLVVKSDYKLVQIPLEEILFIEGLKDYVKIYLSQNQRSVMTLMSMRMLERYLPESMFMRIHRSYIINLHQLRVVERGRVVYESHSLPISESYRGAFNEYVASHSVGGGAVDGDAEG